jgi:hypothetical protein
MQDSEWQDYVGNRKIMLHKHDFYIVKPAEDSEVVPLFCPLCEVAFYSPEDETSYLKFACCQSCYNDTVGPRINDWTDGWRPTPEEMKEKVASRPPLSIE